MSNFISLGCQSGGPADGGIGKLKVELYRAFKRNVTSTFCEAIDEYAPVLRVDGQLQRFGAEGLARLRFAKKKRYITVDVQIPETAWRGKRRRQKQVYLVKQVRAAIVLCVQRLKDDGLVVDEQTLLQQVDRASREYLASNGV